MEVLRRNGVSSEVLVALQTEPEKATAEPRERALLKLAAIMTRSPAASAQGVLDALTAGCSAAQAADAIFVISMYNMVNRVADAYAYPPDHAHPYDPKARIPVLSCPAR